MLLSRKAEEVINRYIADKNPDDFIFPFLKPECKYLSPVQLEVKLNMQVSYIDRLLKKVAVAIGIHQNITLHTARHSFAEHLLDATGDIYQVKDALGHTDIQTTQRYTSRFSQTRTDKANVVYDRWDESADDEQEQSRSA